MSKTSNVAASETVRVTLSKQSVRLLDDLGKRGIYGRNRAEVAARFIDEALQRFVDQPQLKITSVVGIRGKR
jgi:hypothetical protein